MEGRTFARLRWLLVGLVFCRGVVALCVLPPFEGWDEYQHVAYVEHVRETGRRPVFGEASVSRALLARVVTFPQPDQVVAGTLGPLGAVGYWAFWGTHDPKVYRGGTVSLYQAQHAPLYYRLAAPLFGALGGVGDLRAAVGGLRLVNLGLTAAAVWVVAGALRRVVRREADAALATLPLAAHPTFLLNGTRVASDALGVLLAVAAVAALLELAAGADRRSRSGVGPLAFLAGLLAGLAALAKATNLALIPFAGFAWVVAVVRDRAPAPRAAGSAALIAAGVLTALQGEVRFNLEHYGGPTSMQEAVVNRRKGVTPAQTLRAAAAVDWARMSSGLWTRDLLHTGGWSILRCHPVAVRTYRDAASLGLLGWAWWGGVALLGRLREKRGRPVPVFASAWVPAGLLVLVAGYTAGLGYHRVQSILAWGGPTTNPWYACPALPWFLALATAGGLAWPFGRLRPALPLALAAAGLAGEWVGLWGQMVPTYSGGATGLDALHRLASLQPPWLGTPTFALAVVAEVFAVAALALAGRDAARRAGGSRP